MQGHGLPLPQQLRSYQSLFEPLVDGDQKASLASLSSYLSQFRHLEGSLAWGPSLLFGTSAPWLGSYSVDWRIRHLKGQPGCSPAL